MKTIKDVENKCSVTYETLNLKDNDVLVIHLDAGQIPGKDLGIIRDIYEVQYPNNSLLILDKTLDLEHKVFNKEVLKKLLKNLIDTLI
jgi:hypothetical protein